MNYLQIVQIVFELLLGLGAVALGFGYLYSQFRQGNKEGKKSDLDTENAYTTYLKNQIEGFTKIIDDLKLTMEAQRREYDDKLVTMGKDLSAVQASNKEKDVQIQKYLDILQNRDPQLQTFIDEETQWRKDSVIFFDSMGKTLKEISEHVQKEVRVETTIKHEGK